MHLLSGFDYGCDAEIGSFDAPKAIGLGCCMSIVLLDFVI